MKIADIIARLRAQCPEFATIDHGLTSPATLTYPAAMVVPVENRPAAPYVFGSGVMQVNYLKFGVYLMMDRRQDGDADNGAADDFDALCASVRTALIGWSPPDAADVLVYAGGVLAPFSQGAVSWREDFATSEDIRSFT